MHILKTDLYVVKDCLREIIESLQKFDFKNSLHVAQHGLEVMEKFCPAELRGGKNE